MTIKIINAHAIFTENAICLSKRTNWEIEKTMDAQPNDLYVVFGANEIAPQLLNAVDSDGDTVKFIIMNSEQEQSLFFKNKYYLELLKKNVVLNFTEDKFMEKFGIRSLAKFDFEFLNFELEMERIYDFTFIGFFSEERKKKIDELKEKYPTKTFFVDFETKYTDVKMLTDILHQSKCVLNIPYYSKSSLETHRINKALSCGCQVVSFTKPHDDYNDYVNFIDDLNYQEKNIKDFMQKFNEKNLQKVVWIIDQIHKLKKKPF